MLRRSSPSPAGASAAPAPPAPAPAAAAPAAAPRDIWDDDTDSWEEPTDEQFAACEFDCDQPVAERRDEMRARGPQRYSPVERPATLAVSPAPAQVQAAGMPSAGSAAHSAAGTPGARRDSQLTERGYFDVKYYHNKLW